MIGSRMVPALMESEEEFKATFTQWHTYKLVDDVEESSEVFAISI
ncbi:MAG: hypothetical protein ACLRU1_06960 [Veillonella parvula]